MSDKKSDSQQSALAVHSQVPHGKVLVRPSKAITNQQMLSKVYSPGVAAPCQEIARDPKLANLYTCKANSVAVISNGTAVLGLGNLGALASKPVMEGKVALFSSLAYLNAVDLELDETDPEALVRCVEQLSPSFGAINLEDIKAPECFIIEEKLRQKLAIPVLHDDQHGTATAVLAGLMNAVRIQGKNPENCQVVFNGAGAAALATAKLLCSWKFKKENIILCDSRGVVSQQRKDINVYKKEFAVATDKLNLRDVLSGADIFIGLSVGNILDHDLLQLLADKPIIFALANPVPEVLPDIASKARPDAIVATGRSDYPNQINNVLCFPYIFRGALDVQSTTINQQMLIAAASEIAAIAREQSAPTKQLLVPGVLDQQLRQRVPYAVAEAAILSKVATLELTKSDYLAKLKQLQVFYG